MGGGVVSCATGGTPLTDGAGVALVISNEVPRFFFSTEFWRPRDAERDRLLFAIAARGTL
jgi:hypothetical protein